MSESLYERLGGAEGITQIANDLVDIHLVNPAIAPRFTNSNPDNLKKGQRLSLFLLQVNLRHEGKHA